MKKLLILAALNELRGLICASLAALALCHPAHAQNSPLSGLAPRGAVQASDIIPIMPAGGAQLMQTTVAAIIAPATPGGGTGTVQAVNATVPGFSCNTTGTTTLTITCTAISGASSSTFLRGDGAWAVPPGTGGSGSVTSVTCGSGLSGGTITTSGTCSIPNSGVTSGSYTAANITVNAQGFVTAAANGSGGSPTCTQTGAVNSEGCLGVPQNAQTSGYTLVAGDASGLVNMGCSGACTLTIPANASVAFPVGTIIDVTNLGTAVDTIAIASDTLEAAAGGALSSGNVALPVGGALSLLKVATTTWLASGGNAAPTSIYSAPAVSSFTWVNQGSATVSQAVNGQAILLNVPDNGSANLRGLFIATPSTPWKVRVRFSCPANNLANSALCGIYMTDGTKYEGIGWLSQASSISTEVRKWASSTDASSTQAKTAHGDLTLGYGGISCVQIRDDATNLYLDFARDCQNYTNFFSEAVGTYLTPAEVGFAAESITTTSTNFIQVDVMNFSFTGNASLN